MRASFIDLDERIESSTGRSIPEIFEGDGEAAFRALERAAIAELGPADPDPAIRRVIATGGGAVVDPRNRWSLYRGRRTVWLDGRPEVLAQRLRRSPHVRPLVAGRDPIGAHPRPGRTAIPVLRRRRSPPVGDPAGPWRRRYARRPPGHACRRRAVQLERPSFERRRRSAGSCWARASPRARSRRSSRRWEPGARSSSASRAPGKRAVGRSRPACATAAGRSSGSCCPQGEAAKRLSVVENGGARARRPARGALRAAGRHRRRRARGRGRVPGGDVPARRSGHPRADHAGRPGRLVDRRQDRGRPARGQEPRRCLPPAGGDRDRRRAAADAPRATAPGRPRRSGQDGGPSATSGCSSSWRRTGRSSPAVILRRSGAVPWPRSWSDVHGPRSRS